MNPLWNHIIGFSDNVQELKRIQRKGWMRAGVKKPESIADHSYACAMLSMVMGDLCGLDTERLIRMALLHDLVESVTGDLIPRQKKMLGSKVRVLEKRAAIAIFSQLPTRIRRKYLLLMEDCWKQRSTESKVLKDIDRIEMSIQAHTYIGEGYSSQRMAEFLNSAQKDLRTDLGRALFEALGSGRRI